MRILVAGSPLFTAGYRIDRALVRAAAKQRHRDMVLLNVGRWGSGSARTAKEYAEEFGWVTERVQSVSEANADICAAFLHMNDNPTDPHRIVAMKAEKAGIPVWRYYEGGPRQPHPAPGQPVYFDDPDDRDLEPWEEALMVPLVDITQTVEFTLLPDGTIRANWPTVA